MKAKFKINIITEHSKPAFSHQLPIGRYPEFIFFENGDNSSEYDLVVVYENIKNKILINCDPRNILFISGEPPLSRVYTKEFLNQFGFVISSHDKIKNQKHFKSQQALPWHFGFDYTKWEYKYNYEFLAKLKPGKKEKKMSIIASTKGMLPGHKKRMNFVEKLMKYFPDEIDFYGKGLNPVNDKADAILPYKMTICIENSHINDYWSEKLADAFLGYSLPIYSGCLNIEQYFPVGSMILIDLDRQKETMAKIRWLLDNCDNVYTERLDDISFARKKLLNDYNIYPTLVAFFKRENLFSNSNFKKISLSPNQNFRTYKTDLALLRMKRFILKSTS